ncbi:hypothetical protein LINPERPRIM_LOCUS37310 [Linum perenne]
MDGKPHCRFLIQFYEKGSEAVSLSQTARFFANSDPDMPAAPVPASEVLVWISESISSTLESITEEFMLKRMVPPVHLITM